MSKQHPQYTVTAQNLKKCFPRREPVLNNVSFQVQPHEMALIMGKSGSGKSTLLHCLAGLETVESGNISILGKDVTKLTTEQYSKVRLDHIGIVFQFFNLIPSLTIEQNVALPTRLAGWNRQQVQREVDRLLEYVGISHIAKSFPEQVSGGEAQRTALARALILEPSLILADEPTGNLDDESGEVVMDLLCSLRLEFPVSVVLVTHDMALKALADTTYTLHQGTLLPDKV